MEPPADMRSDQMGLPARAVGRWVLAGTGVFESPVMSVSLADPPVNRRALE